jgi:predicted glycoside hydrolase/deacetylase ChbG (UPF0249 family)
MLRQLFSISVLIIVTGCAIVQQARAPDSSGEPIRLIIRGDDFGMCRSVNVAVEKAFKEGVLTCTSLMVPCPWFEDAARICRNNPGLQVGVHLTLNSEWAEYRWGPVLPASEVPSLVDDDGYFYATVKGFLDANPKPEEVEKELRAQVERAYQAGIDVAYVDYHMGTAVSRPEYRRIVEKIAQEHQIPISRYYGEKDTPNIYHTPPRQKTKRLVEILEGLQPGFWLLVCHPGLDSVEMQGMSAANPASLQNIAANRGAVTRALTSPAVKRLIKRRHIQLLGYRDIRNSIIRKSPH